MKPIITVNNLSKQYRLGNTGTGTLTHDINRWWYKLRGKDDPYLQLGETNDRTLTGQSDYVWALRDINFEVQKGEVLGIIGKNGAGKSTLLKLLSRVTAPTTGKIVANGRIASLLEVGTGFHPELTGRENIYLNGAILGMRKIEIRKKFDEIVDFAGCQRYIDTPVKRFSSGMYTRLAFAVAAHLEPEILIVDEVLAVGDAEFQSKAIGKMKDVSTQDGRTVLFVSHNMASVQSLCSRSILLENGRLTKSGPTEEIIEHYLSSKITEETISLSDRKDRIGEGELKFTSTWLENSKGQKVTEYICGDDVKIIVAFDAVDMLETNNIPIQLSVAINTMKNESVSDLSNVVKGEEIYLTKNDSTFTFECRIPNINLNRGVYLYTLSIVANGILQDHVLDAGRLVINEGDYYGTGRLPDEKKLFLMDFSWKENT